MNQQVKPGLADPSLHATQHGLEKGPADFRQEQAYCICPTAGKRARGSMRKIVQGGYGRTDTLCSFRFNGRGTIQYTTDCGNGNPGSLGNIGNCGTGRGHGYEDNPK
jgi:hypothetical protein